MCHHSPAVFPVVLVVTARWYAMQMDPVRESEVKKKMMLERFQEEVCVVGHAPLFQPGASDDDDSNGGGGGGLMQPIS